MIRIDKVVRNQSFANFKEDYFNSFFIDKRNYKLHQNFYSKIDALAFKYRRGVKKDILQFFKANDYSKIKQAVVGNASILNTIIGEVNDIVGDTLLFCVLKKGNYVRTKFGSELASVFNYDMLRNGSRDLGLIKYLNIKTCAYCNINLIETYQADKERTSVSYDHFYSQVKYPYLSVSLYNIIPSCGYCNENLKRVKELSLDSHFNPYYSFPMDSCFNFTLNSYVINDIFDHDYNIDITCSRLSSRVDNTLSTFHILQRCNAQKDIVNLIWFMKDGYNDNIINEKIRLYSRKLGHQITKDELFETELGFNFSQSETLTKPFNKLKRDITLELFYG